MYFMIHPLGWIDDERMVLHCLNLAVINLVVHPLRPWDFPRSSWFLSGLGKSLGCQGCSTLYTPPLSCVRIHCILYNLPQCYNSIWQYTSPYWLRSMAHRMGWLSREWAHVWAGGTDCYSGSGAALLPMVSCRVATLDPITVRPLPASSPFPACPIKSRNFGFPPFCKVLETFWL